MTDERRIAIMRDALNNIAEPISWLQYHAEKQKMEFDGDWAYRLSQSPGYFREIAKRALKEADSE